MSLQATYSSARANLASLLDQVESDCETLIIKRRGKADIAVVPADELRGLRETHYLMSSPENRKRLLRTLDQARKGKGAGQSIESLKREVKLGETR